MMKPTSSTAASEGRPLPRHWTPTLHNAGQFPLDERGYQTKYLARTHALHIHLYTGVVQIGAQSYALQPGDCTLSPAGIVSAYDLPQAGYHWCVHFAPPTANPRRAADDTFRIPLHLRLGPRREFIIDRLKQVTGFYARGKFGDRNAAAVAAAGFQETLLQIAMLAEPQRAPQPTAADTALEKLLTILHARFNEPLRVEQLADEVELTQNYLARCFRSRFGMTIPRYLLTRRIDHSCYLLTATNMPVHRVAQRVGLPDAQYFNKQFRRITGQSPSVYRSIHANMPPRNIQ